MLDKGAWLRGLQNISNPNGYCHRVSVISGFDRSRGGGCLK